MVGAGASIAHALHEEGIPLVIASQFPLSFAGSVIMAQVLYLGLLAGEDPRTLLVNLRRRLQTEVPASHDWASIVAYASLPPDLDRKLDAVQIHQSFRRLEAAMNYADRMLAPTTGDSYTESEWQNQRTRLKEARDRIDKLMPKSKDSKDHGILASADKRLAETLWSIGKARTGGRPEGKDEALVRDRLITSRKNYETAFRRDRSQVWAVVQTIVLTAVLQHWDKSEELSEDQWRLAEIFSREEVRLGDRQRKAWAHANLMELYILAPLIGKLKFDTSDARTKAMEHALAFKNVTDLTSIEIHSTRRQVLRYSSIFLEINSDLKDIAGIAEEIAPVLPESSKYA